MAKIYISLMDTTASLEIPLRAALAAYEIKVNTANRTTPVDGGKSKMQEANEWGADLYLAIRTGKNPVCLKAAGNPGGKSWTLCEAIGRMLQDGALAYNGVSNGDQIAEIAYTKMVSAYVIISESDDTAWLDENLDYTAEMCAEGIETYFEAFPPIGVDEPDKPADPDEPDAPAVPLAGDAALGAAVRTILEAFWEARDA
jgi:hypothetical protein